MQPWAGIEFVRDLTNSDAPDPTPAPPTLRSGCRANAIVGRRDDWRGPPIISLGAFETKTSSWLATPAEIRRLGGAIFADRRYDRVFLYHNGAQSYYGGRGFRGSLRV